MPDNVLVARHLVVIFQTLAGQAVSARQLFEALLASPATATLLRQRGVPEDRCRMLLHVPSAGPAGAAPVITQPAAHPGLATIRGFGRLITEPPGPTVDREVMRPAVLRRLVAHLLVPRSRSVLLVAPAGVGKTALISHLARLRLDQTEALPQPLRRLELFELSPEFPRLTQDTAAELSQVVGQQRVRQLFRTLQDNQEVILVIPDLLPFLATLYHLSVSQELVEGFKHNLENGSVTCLGCLQPEQMDQVKQFDPALPRHFFILPLPGLSLEETVAVLRARLPRLEKHFAGLAIPTDPAFLRQVVELTEEYLRDRQQPEKSLRLLEDACALPLASSPGVGSKTVNSQHLLEALGRAASLDSDAGLLPEVLSVGEPGPIDQVYQRLTHKIVGQDEILRRLSRAFVAGLADKGWVLRTGPRGVFLFGGPTGVGKTETALLLAQLLGGERQALIRVDCQTFQGGGTGHEANTLMWRLLGVAPGYVGYTPGCKDGLLVRVRDFPQSVLLLDEFEKADPAVGKLFLRILDEGRALDSEGNDLDFRRCLVVLTTNAGVTYHSREPRNPVNIFAPPTLDRAPPPIPEANLSGLYDDLQSRGLGMEFLARIPHVFLFRGLNAEAIGTIVERQLDTVRFLARSKGFELEYDPEVVKCLVNSWDPHLGARHVANLLCAWVLDSLNLAEAQGKLKTARQIRIVLGSDNQPIQKGEALLIPLGPSSVP